MTIISTEVTLCLLVKGGNISLAKKKRGFGKDRWNGYGGKVKPGEAIKIAAIRELLEEANNGNGRGGGGKRRSTGAGRGHRLFL